MDDLLFDALARTLVQSRRTALAGLMGLAASGLTFSSRSSGKKNRKNCKRKAIKICTGYVCGERKNNCGKTFKCECRAGLVCLPNGGCGLPCGAGCPAGSPPQSYPCACSPTGEEICLVRDVSCQALTTHCLTSSECPEQAACGEAPCGPGGAIERRCLPLCRG